MKKLSILHLSWRDIKNPIMGGAEVLSHEVHKWLVEKGHKVTWLAATFPGSKATEVVDGINIIRRGEFYSVHKKAMEFWKQNKDSYDIVIDELHGYPFFTKYYVNKPRIIHIDEVAGKIWMEMWPWLIAVIGLLFEKFFLHAIRKEAFMTISDSTKNDLLAHGVVKDKISVFRVGDYGVPIKTLEKKVKPYQIVFVGRICKMKGISDLIRAFDIIATEIPDSTLKICGRTEDDFADNYGKELKEILNEMINADKVEILQSPVDKVRDRIVFESGIQISCSVKEGWGIIISEAAKLGTPSITYNVEGYRDIIVDGETGILVDTIKFESIAKEAIGLLTDPVRYDKLRASAHEYYKDFTLKNTADEIETILYETIDNVEMQSKPSAISRIFVSILLYSTNFVGTIYSKTVSLFSK